MIRGLVQKAAVCGGVAKLFRYLNRDKVVIVMYHGVVSGKRDYRHWSQLPVTRFEQQLKHLKRHYTLLHLSEILNAIRDGDPLPPHAAAVTFDDGFLNNYTTAYPVLKRYQIPATIFLTTSFVDSNDLLWCDLLFVSLRETRRKLLDLSDFGLHKFRLRSIPEKEDAFWEIVAYMKTLPVRRKDILFDAIHRRLQTNRNGCPYLPDFVGMSWQQAHAMQRSGLIEFGAHTVTHEILSRLSPDAMRFELEESCRIVREKLQLDRISFAYPNGGRADFTFEATRILREIGCTGGLATIEGLNDRDTNLYALKRIPVGSDTSLAQFVLMTSGFTEWARSCLRERSGCDKSLVDSPSNESVRELVAS